MASTMGLRSMAICQLAPRNIAFTKVRPIALSRPWDKQRYLGPGFRAHRSHTMSRISTLDSTLADRLPIQAHTLFEAKAQKQLSFEQIAKELGRNEVAVAAIFYGQAQTSPEDVDALARVLGIEKSKLDAQLAGFPFRGQVMDMPPKEPLIYRLYEIIQNYGYAYKAILNEKLGDGIMSAISFSTKVEKETDKDGNNWAVITMRGKWLPFSRF
ncbi:MAG: hypothetical protein Q9226_006306 [Calogaya cf. arnoldii]